MPSEISPTLLVLEDRKGHSVCGIGTWLREHKWSHQLGVWMAFHNPPACVHIRTRGAWNEGGLTVPLLLQCLSALDMAPSNMDRQRWRIRFGAKDGVMTADCLNLRNLVSWHLKEQISGITLTSNSMITFIMTHYCGLPIHMLKTILMK